MLDPKLRCNFCLGCSPEYGGLGTHDQMFSNADMFGGSSSRVLLDPNPAGAPI